MEKISAKRGKKPTGVWHPVAARALKLRKMGLSYSEIARQVGISKQVMRYHVKRGDMNIVFETEK